MSNDARALQCRLCAEVGLKLGLRLDRAPRNISRLLRPEELSRDYAVSLEVYECSVCGFVQLAQTLEPTFYDDYVMTTSHSAQMRAYQREQASSFVARFGLVGTRVVEIGCGDGNYLKYLYEAGVTPVGIEPSQPFRNLALAQGFTVLAGYVGRTAPVPEAPYDAFVTRQVFEHVPDPNDFLQGVRFSLGAGAAGLVEVPSLEQAVEHARFYDFFPDHLNYYSDRTLRYALERNGFEVVETMRGMNGEYNIALVRVAPALDLSAIQTAVDALSRDLHGFVTSCRSQGKRVAVWGSGGKGIAALATADLGGLAYVVDSDPQKQGLYTPVSHLPVYAPDQLRREPVDAVIITALAYQNEIIAQLRQEVGFRGQIALLGPRLRMLE